MFGYGSGPFGVVVVDKEAPPHFSALLTSPPQHHNLVHVKFFDRISEECRYLGSWQVDPSELCATSLLEPAVARLQALLPEKATSPDPNFELALLGSQGGGPPKLINTKTTGAENSVGGATVLYLQWNKKGFTLDKTVVGTSVLEAWLSRQSCEVSIEPSPELLAALRGGSVAMDSAVREELLANLTALSRRVSLYRGAAINAQAVVDFTAASKELLSALAIRSVPLRFSCQKGETRVTVCAVSPEIQRGQTATTERHHIASMPKRFQPNSDHALCIHILELLQMEGRGLMQAESAVRVWYEFDASAVRLEARSSNVLQARRGLLSNVEGNVAAVRAQQQQQQQQQPSAPSPQKQQQEMSAEARRALYAERFGNTGTAKSVMHNEEVRSRTEAESEEHRKRQIDRHRKEQQEEREAKQRERDEVLGRTTGANLLAREKLRKEIEEGKEEDRKTRMEREMREVRRERAAREEEKQRIQRDLREQREEQAERRRMATAVAAEASKVVAAPSPTPGTLTVQFQMPTGEKLVASFQSSQTLDEVKSHVTAHHPPLAEQHFTFMSSFPRHVCCRLFGFE